LASSRSDFFHPEGLTAGDDHDAVVHQSIKQADGRVVIGQEAPPVLEALGVCGSSLSKFFTSNPRSLSRTTLLF
jgi:hypothetical protein